MDQSAFNGQLLLGVAVLLNILVSGAALIKRNPRLEQQFAERDTLGEFKGEVRGQLGLLQTNIRSDISRIETKIDESNREITASHQRSAADLHNRITGHETRISKLEAMIESLRASS